MKKSTFILLSFFIGSPVFAQLIIPKIIGNGMVLQQGQPVPVWGQAKAGDKVWVQFKDQQKETITNVDGSWALNLDPMPAASEPARLVIKSGKEKIVVSDILVGEVWLCSGQSNMEYTMRKNSKVKVPSRKDWPVKELETAHNKNIRIFLVDRKKMKPDSTHSGWSVAEDSALRSFSAVGYFFAKELNKNLQVPVGIISAAIPGSRIEPWMPVEAFTALPFFRDPSDSTHKIDGDPGKFYATMIEPLVPFALKGFLWYQGESNCFLNERVQYAYKMKALINYWRKIWQNAQLPFYYVQIAPYYYSKAKDRPYTIYSEPEFWEAQAAVLKLSNTAMIPTIDLNEDAHDLHPINKWDIGKRLAHTSLSKTYHTIKEQPMGPVFARAEQHDEAFIIDFDYKGKGLVSRDNKPLNNFEVEDEKGTCHAANAVIKNNKVWVSAIGVKKPKSVRFAWREDARPNLYNATGWPALPFRTDNPIEKEFH